MRNLPPLSCVLAVCLLGALVYFGYQVTTTSLRYGKAQELQQKWFADNQGPGPEEIDQALADVDEALKKFSSVEFKSLKAQLLLYKAWYYPDQSLEPLRTALPLGLEVYREGEDYEGFAAWQVAWGLSYAHLPARLERWAGQVQVRAPYMRPTVAMLIIEDRILLDDVDSIRGLAQQELDGRRNSVESRIVAMDGLLMLDEIDAAVELAPPSTELANLDPNQLMVLVNLSLETKHLAQAREQLQFVEAQLPDDPGVALTNALVEIALNGPDSSNAALYLDRATQSTRRSISRAGVTAVVYAELARLTGEERWVDALGSLQAGHPTDYDVQASAAALKLQQVVDRGLPGSPAEQLASMHNLVAMFERARSLAASAAQRQEACFKLAEVDVAASVYAGSAGASLEARAALDDSLARLRQGLGDPTAVDAIVSEHPPDYSEFLLNPLVREARERWPDFDRQVHECVIDYLNRRIDLFSDIQELKPMDHLSYSSGAVENEPSPDDAQNAAPAAPGQDGTVHDWQPA